MNRNDLVITTTQTASSSGSGGGGGIISNGGGASGMVGVTPRSPRKSNSSMSPSPSSRKKKSASHLFTMGGGGGGGGGPGSMMMGTTTTTTSGTSSSFPKGASLLEGESVHLALPSFHAKAGGKNGVWKCAACQHENHSALSNECSVCGMVRSESSASNSHNDQAGHEMLSMGSSEPSEDSFMYEGNQSENSLSLHNSFSAVDPQLSDELLAPYDFGHSSVPTGLASPSSLLGASSGALMTARMHNSFSVAPRPTRAARGRGRRPGVSSSRSTSRNRRGGGVSEEDGNSSVRSFSDWNGNEQIKSWQCQTCTFINESVLQLNCEMCGQLREDADTSTNPGPTHVPVVASASSASANQDAGSINIHNNDNELDDEAFMNQLQEEQLRELVGLQKEIFASLESERAANNGTAFDIHELQTEIDHVQREYISSSSRGGGGGDMAGLGFIDETEEDSDDEGRLEELLAAQANILKGMQKGHQVSSSSAAAAPSSSASLSPSFGTSRKPSANPSPYASAARAQPHHYSPAHDHLFGQGPSNTAPQTNAGISLKESMEAAGGKLRIEDICVPLLWGETISSGKASSGKIQT